MDMAIKLAQRIEDNQRIHLGFTLLVFAPALAMAPASQIAAASFHQQPPYQRQQNHGPSVYYHCGLTEHFSRDCNNPPLPSSVLRNHDTQNNRSNNNNVPNQRSNHANINFFEEDPLVEATGESASQSEENLFYKKKKAKVDFVLDSNKASKSIADNNEPPKAKVFKNPPKLEPPEIVQKFGPYSVVKDLIETPTNKCPHQAELADNSNVISLICKAQVAGYFIDLILDSGSFVSIIAKHFLEAIGKKIDEPSTQLMTNIHGNKKKGLGIAKAIPVCINGIIDNKWLKKAKALLDYELCKLTIRCGEKSIVVKCHYWTTPPVTKQNQEEEQSNESDDDESDDKNQKEQEETAELAYTIFTSNSKPLDNVKANKEKIIINGKLICWPYYDIFKRTFDKKPGKKAKYSYWWHGPCKSCLIYYKDWEPISLILQEELKEVQKSFENEPPEIQSLAIEQRKPSSEERKVDIKNLLARNSPVISKESNTSR
ncbi:hypothetical protein G9A89_018780 [Geosiphon pyriformis]|nr:hypothetical protein G9A89_018780 [Geosiphon pyriformis]